MNIIKRNGSEMTFDGNKIVAAITKANNSSETASLTPEQIHDIADYVEYKCRKMNRAGFREEIQDMVENQIMATGAFELARNYVRYRYQRTLVRKANNHRQPHPLLIECNNEEVKQENSNKNPTVNSVQRDYMAGEVSKDLDPASAAAPRHRGGGQAGHHPFPRLRLFRTAHAQLRSGQSGGYAAERHRDQRDPD